MRPPNGLTQWYVKALALVVAGLLGEAGWWLGQWLEAPVQERLRQLTAQPLQVSPVVLVLLDDTLPPPCQIQPWEKDCLQPILKTVQAAKPQQVLLDGPWLGGPPLPSSVHNIQWARPWQQSPVAISYPAVSVGQLAAQAQQLQGKTVIVTLATPLYRQTVSTALSYQHLAADVQAHLIDPATRRLRPAPGWQQALIVLGLFLCGLLLCQVRVTQGLIYTAGLMALYAWLVLDQLVRDGRVLQLVLPEVALVLGFGAAVAWRSHQLVSHTLQRLVSPAVLQEIRLRNGDLTAGGRRVEITSMMVDIRNFTTIAEQLQPGQVSGLLSEFYEAVVPVIFQHRGTVDKFLGDGVLVMFGAPLPQSDHADAALAAALALADVTQALTTRWAQEKNLHTHIGISLNSGPAFVGFVGPKNRLEFTALGDTVNVCVRLQDVARRFHRQVVLSQNTVEVLQRLRPALDSLGSVTVKGRSAPVTVYSI